MKKAYKNVEVVICLSIGDVMTVSDFSSDLKENFGSVNDFI